MPRLVGARYEKGRLLAEPPWFRLARCLLEDLAEDVGQDAAVAVVLAFDRGIDAGDQRGLVDRAVGTADDEGHRSLRLDRAGEAFEVEGFRSVETRWWIGSIVSTPLYERKNCSSCLWKRIFLTLHTCRNDRFRRREDE